jgi:hypothetical protein
MRVNAGDGCRERSVVIEQRRSLFSSLSAGSALALEHTCRFNGFGGGSSPAHRIPADNQGKESEEGNGIDEV